MSSLFGSSAAPTASPSVFAPFTLAPSTSAPSTSAPFASAPFASAPFASTAFGRPSKSGPATPNLSITNHRFFHHDLRLLEEGYLSDVKVSCGTKTWDLHKIILCSRCVWFAKAFTAGFAETESGLVKIEEFDPEKVYWMIRYIYTGVIDIKELRSDSTVYAACLDLYIMGDFFMMPELKEEALHCLSAHCNTKAGELQLQQPQGEALKQLVDLDALYQGIKLAFGDSADEDNPVAKILVNFVHKARFCLLPNPKFLELLGQVPTFSVALMRILYSGDYDLKGIKYLAKCTTCGMTLGQGKHFEKIVVPCTDKVVDPKAYCLICSRTSLPGTKSVFASSRSGLFDTRP